ncbi:MAG: hypothetical protein WBY94_28590 [Polyangiaceae bacterium]
MAFAWRFRCCALVMTLLGVQKGARADDQPTFADRPDEEVRDVQRRLNVLLNPLAVSVGLYGGEVDFVLGRFAAVAVEGAIYRHGDGVGEALSAGLLIYPLGGALHRLYFEPRVAWARPLGLTKLDWSADVVGLGATAGWQWTWDYGLSLRAGGGVIYFLTGQAGGLDNSLPVGAQIVLDGSVGWAF